MQICSVPVGPSDAAHCITCRVVPCRDQLPHALGGCNGGHPETSRPTPRVTSLYPEPGQTSNTDLFRSYKFVLAMENSNTPGYGGGAMNSLAEGC
jgi:hypothetical protein